MSSGKSAAARRVRLLFEELVDLESGERAAHLGRLDPNDPDVAAVGRLLDAHDHATEQLDALEFLRTPDAPGRADSSFDAVAAFAPDYAIEGELHGGGMSRVFFGRDARLGRKIVAKVLPPELGAAVHHGRFQKEITLAAQLRHPHIVPLLESGEAAGCLYYTMPFIEGESLRDRLGRDGVLPTSIALRFATEIADALAYAHRLGVIHCDVKPGNVLIDSGHAVVTDFGIARALSDAATATATQSGTVMGTPAYMSPEQASPDGNIDARTDVYSLGCVLSEMLYGAPPVAGVVAVTPAEGASRARVPSRLRAIIARATAPRPADRFQSAQEMRDALAAEAAAPRADTRAWWTIIAACAVLILGAWAALRSPPDHSFASPQAVVRRVTMRGDVKLAAISPGGAYVAFVTSDTSVLRVGDIGAGTQVAFETGERNGPPRPWSIRQIGWNRDGTILYFLPEPFRAVTAVPKLGPWRMVIANPLLAGPLRHVAKALDSATGFTVSPVDSSIAVWSIPRGPVHRHPVILHVHSGNRFRVDTIDVRVDMQWGMLAYSPNGRWLAACGGSRDHDGAWRLALLATDGTTQTLLDSADAPRASCGVIWSARGDSLHVWPATSGADMMSYRIDDASGKPLGRPAPFRLRQPSAGARTSFTLSANGKQLAYVEHTLQRYVAVAELGTGIEVPSRVAEVGVRDPSRPEISPAGDRFAYIVAGDSGSAIYTRELAGGEPHRLSRDFREGLSGVRWSDDATRIATLTRRDSHDAILILDATGTELMTVRPRHAVYDTSMSRPGYDWAAGGTGIMYNTLNPAKRRPEVRLIDVASGQERLLIAAEAGFSAKYLSLPVWSPDGRSILYDSLGILIVRDARTGARRATPPSGGAVTPCRMPQPLPCEKGTMVPIRWRGDGTIFSERINRDRSTTIWRSDMTHSPTLYAHLPKECELVSLDRDAHGAVCQVHRDESDVFLVTRP